MVVKVRDEPNPDAWSESTLSYISTETIQEGGICQLVYAPAQVSAETNQAAQTLARRAVANFRGRGIFGVEMFLLEDNSLLVNEIAPRYIFQIRFEKPNIAIIIIMRTNVM